MDNTVNLKEPFEPKALHEELKQAVDKFTKQDERAQKYTGFGATYSGQGITRDYLSVVAQGVQQKLSGPRPRSSTVEFRFERLIRNLSPEHTALAILQSGLHAVGVKSTHRDAVMAIGTALFDECWAAKLLEVDAKLHKRIHKKVREEYGSVALRKTVAKKLADNSDFNMPDWTRPMLAHAGQWGMSILLEAMPDVFELTEPVGYKDQRGWTIKDEAIEKAQAAINHAVAASPVYQPREAPPADWSGFYSRVAEDERTVGSVPIMRTGHKDTIAAVRHAIHTGSMAPAVRALNLLQSVPFKINTWIMGVIEQCHAQGIDVEGIPPKKTLPLPQKLPLEEYKALSVEQRKLVSKTLQGRKKANKGIRSNIVQYGMDMATAKRLAPVERFHTPMNMDWRGRVYSLSHFNFQRSDRVRAMFLYADGEPITEEGIYWLKIHVANCGDFGKVSKKPMEERIKWVDDNLSLILDYVRSPLENTGWTKADAPFLFLAACREIIAALEQGPTYVCHLPVSWDGACSGLQHLCSATRAPEGRLVNLTNDLPHDVYQVVADRAKLAIEADLNSTEMVGKENHKVAVRVLAKTALAYGIDRSLFKRNTMTFCYSSPEYGMAEQHFEDTMEPLELKVLQGKLTEHPFGDDEAQWRMFSRYLAKKAMAAIKDVVTLPAGAMEFMQILARKLAHEGKPLRWTSPAGIPCINRYHEVTTQAVQLWCYDKGVNVRVQMLVATGYEAPIAKAKSAAGISPNFVHSLDAAHLLLTVGAAADEGIVDVVTVHDSFGCLPSRAPRFHQIIREQFLRMYTEHDVLAELLASAKADLSPAGQEKLPPLPKMGTLSIEDVINARYAFA